MRRGVSWNLASAIVVNVVRIVVVAVLGRALTSADFGIVAAGISVNVILSGIRDIGIGRALVQRKDLEHGHVTTAFAVSAYLGVGLSALLVLAAPILARFFNIESSTNVLRGLGLLFAVRGVSSVSRMLSERSMRFNLIAIFDAGSFVAGSVTAMVTAVLGFGPWSLMLGYLVEESSAAACYMVASPPPLSLRIDVRRLRELMSYGMGQTFTQITGMIATYGDNFVVGHVLGARPLGYYTRAYDLVKMPAFVFEAIVARVLFPAFSRIQDEHQRISQVFARVLFANALVLLPASALLIVIAPEAIRIIVGKGWESTILPLQIFATTILARTSTKLGAVVTQAAGRANSMAAAYTTYMICVVGGAALSIRWGIVGVSVTTTLAIFVTYAICTYLGMSASRTSLADVVRAHLPGCFVSVCVLAVAMPTARLLRPRVSFVGVTLGCVAVSAIAALAVIGFWLRRGGGHFAWVRGELARVTRRRATRGKTPR